MAFSVLVVGGAGYIGSHMVRMLLDAGHEVVTLDDLSTGFRDAICGGTFVHGDVADEDTTGDVLRKHRVQMVMHFASRIAVGESTANPGLYYQNNVAKTVNLLNAMVRHDVKNLVFSSSAAVYGVPTGETLDEDCPAQPISVYGRTKLMAEQIMEDFSAAHGVRSVRFRYFNAAGAHPDGSIGERHDPETHLIPLAIRAAVEGERMLTVNGDDYPTADGTCIRDYVHVMDICSAHLLALEHLRSGGPGGVFNLGNGRGFSIREVIATVEDVTGRAVRRVVGPRRQGDPPVLVADAGRAVKELNWRPAYGDLQTIVRHAWQWEKKHLGQNVN